MKKETAQSIRKKENRQRSSKTGEKVKLLVC